MRFLGLFLRCIEAGADGIFAEAVHELSDYKAFAEALDAPILANITEFGATPLYIRQFLSVVQGAWCCTP